MLLANRESDGNQADRDLPASLVKGRRILIVEDDYFLASDLAAGLRRLGAYIIGPFATLAQGLRGARESDGIERAVIDVDLQGEPAYPLADLLHSRNIPFVFTTGYGRETLPERFRRELLCLKPIDPFTLGSVLA